MQTNIIYKYLIGIFLSISFSIAFGQTQYNIEAIDSMPDFPQPYIMRDWNKVAESLENAIFNTNRQGQHLPLLTYGDHPSDPQKDVYFIPSYVGISRDGTESITCLGAISSGLIASASHTEDFTRSSKLIPNYFNNNEGLVLNGFNSKTGGSFWYELFPHVLFYRCYNYYRNETQLTHQFTTIADKWYEACIGMGGNITPWQIPDFNHTAYSFTNNSPIDNNVWTEPDAAAGIAWLEYMAYCQSGNSKYLNGTKWSMDYLDNIAINPFYEVLLPLAAYTSARMNAELDSKYNTEKLFNWCLSADNTRNWGVTNGKWGEHDCSGLIGSIGDKNNNYAFAMNTFDMAASIVPIVRYDERFANAVGKWMLNLANAARLFYPAYLPEGQQTDYNWSVKYDTNSSIAYEGLRQSYCEIDRLTQDYQTTAGKIISGTIDDTKGTNKIYQTFTEDFNDRLEHTWKIELTPTDIHKITIAGKTSGAENESFEFSFSNSPSGPYTPLCSFNSKTDFAISANINTGERTIYLMVKDTNSRGKVADTIFIDDIWIESRSKLSPYATGDAKSSGWGKTNLGVYGSVFVGILAGLIDKTNIEGVLQLDCLATDFFHTPAYPTYLYYNPFSKSVNIKLETGDNTKDLYECLNNTFIADNITGNLNISIPPKSSKLIVICPANSIITHSNNKLYSDDICIDYFYKTQN